MSDKPKRPEPIFRTLAEIAMALVTDDRRLTRVDGRTLPKGFQWSGHDIPGRGKAATRRLKQLAKAKRKD